MDETFPENFILRSKTENLLHRCAENITRELQHTETDAYAFSEWLATAAVSVAVQVVMIIVSMKLWTTFVTSSKDRCSKLPLPPGGAGLPFIGETIHLILGGNNYFSDRREKFGNVYRTHLFGKPTIRVVGPENVRKVLKNEHSHVTSQWPKSTKILLGEGSLSQSPDDQHKIRRRILSKAFKHEALSSYVPVVQEIIGDAIDEWVSLDKTLVYNEVKKLTLSIAFQILTGMPMSKGHIDVFGYHFEKYVNNLFSLPYKMPGFGLSKGIHAKNKLMEMIEERMKDKEKEDHIKRFNDVFSTITDKTDESQLTSEDLEMGLEFMFAGNETTSSAATSTVMFLERHPVVVEKIRQELKDHGIIGGCASSGNGMTFIQLQKLEYLSNVINEVLRLLPPIGGGFRKAVETFEVGGYQIPKGWSVVYSIRETHHTLASIENSSDFNPDRWSGKRPEKYSYLPFGAGARMCVGQQFAKMVLKLLTVELVTKCDWTLLNKEPKIKYIPVPHPIDGLPTKFTYHKDYVL